MARGKKKETLTPEERLQAALVPESEQPYPVPGNWCWTRIANLCSLFNGKAFKPTDWNKTGIPIVRIQNLNNSEAEYNLYSGTVEDKYKLYGGELLFAWSGTPGTSFGAHIWWGKEAVLNQHIFRVDFDERYINKIYFKHAINQQLDMLISVAHGGAGLQHVTKGVFEATPIPLPPFAEQQRIVDRIENLFAKLDEAKQKAQDALDSFETRKAAILHKAFTGELTAQWRKEHGVGIDSWKEKEIGQIAFVTKLAGFEYTKNIAPNLMDAGVPLFKGKNVQKGGLVLEFESYIPENISDELPRSQLNRKCLLAPYVGTIGNIAIFDGSFKAHLGSNVGKIEINSDTYEEYVLYYLRSDFGYRELTKQKKATAQESISIQAIREVLIRIPLQEEQKEIVRILDDLLAKEQQAKEAAEAVLEQIDLIKKAILARAFRGELGTNDPSEESAVFLLKEIVSTTQEKLDSIPKRQSVKHKIPVEIQMQLTTAIQEKLYRFILENPHCTVEKATFIEKDVLKVTQALRELQSKSLISQNAEDNTLTAVV